MTDPEGNLTAQAQGRWEGKPGSYCDHRSVGHRAWCFQCQEWCYPETPCLRCTKPDERIADLEARLSQALEERDAWKQRFEDDAHDFHEMSEQLNAALEAARIAEAKAALHNAHLITCEGCSKIDE